MFSKPDGCRTRRRRFAESIPFPTFPCLPLVPIGGSVGNAATVRRPHCLPYHHNGTRIKEATIMSTATFTAPRKAILSHFRNLKSAAPTRGTALSRGVRRGSSRRPAGRGLAPDIGFFGCVLARRTRHARQGHGQRRRRHGAVLHGHEPGAHLERAEGAGHPRDRNVGRRAAIAVDRKSVV